MSQTTQRVAEVVLADGVSQVIVSQSSWLSASDMLAMRAALLSAGGDVFAPSGDQ